MMLQASLFFCVWEAADKGISSLSLVSRELNLPFGFKTKSQTKLIPTADRLQLVALQHTQELPVFDMQETLGGH